MERDKAKITQGNEIASTSQKTKVRGREKLPISAMVKRKKAYIENP